MWADNIPLIKCRRKKTGHSMVKKTVSLTPVNIWSTSLSLIRVICEQWVKAAQCKANPVWKAKIMFTCKVSWYCLLVLQGKSPRSIRKLVLTHCLQLHGFLSKNNTAAQYWGRGHYATFPWLPVILPTEGSILINSILTSFATGVELQKNKALRVWIATAFCNCWQ